jgi:apolipoprotein N-acyltransferase
LGLIALSITAGVLLGAAVSPFGADAMVWFGFVPLFVAIGRAQSVREAALMGATAGFVFGLVVTRPLVSSMEWTGWAALSEADRANLQVRQAVFLNGLWIVVSSSGIVTWGPFGALLKHLWGTGRLRLLVAAPSLWVVWEWLRCQLVWRYSWAALGTATEELPALRQLGAYGGPWLLSAVVILANCGLYLPVFGPRPRSKNLLAATVCGLAVVAAWAMGAVRLDRFEEPRTPLVAGALQHHMDRYVISDFTVTGLSRQYVALMDEIFARMGDELDLLVLPESVSFGSVSLDGTPNPDVHPEVQVDVRDWEVLLADIIGDHSTTVAVGTVTSLDSQPYNSMLFFTREGLQGLYHKQELVPFAERVPTWASILGVGGETHFSPGEDSAVVVVRDAAIGAFICQEVLLPHTLRRSVRDGAEILVTGGNDGVFADPAVKQIHADHAQLRAVETGRYIVRAMKTGISAIIDPTGRELQRSGTDPVFLFAGVEPRSDVTPYVRFGDWVVWLSGLIVTGLAVTVWRGRGAVSSDQTD